VNCRICFNEKNNTPYVLREMMFGTKETFEYFQCSSCDCIQIKEVPQNLGDYYPSNYYSFSDNTSKIKKLNYFKRLQYEHLSGIKPSFLGAIVSYRYKSGFADVYKWCKSMKMNDKNARILDIGSGGGEILKRLEVLGFTDLTGSDPFIEKDVYLSDNLRLLKKDISELEGKYDIIMSHHSLEHIDNHAQVLSHINNLLADDGRVLIRIPIFSKPLFEKYGVDLVTLDPPRHLYVHSFKSITTLLEKQGFEVLESYYDANVFDIIASEQYQRDIDLFNKEKSYVINPKISIFSSEEIKTFKKQMAKLNADRESDTIVLVLRKKKD
jgi:SAM-dependent methyltransferase